MSKEMHSVKSAKHDISTKQENNFNCKCKNVFENLMFHVQLFIFFLKICCLEYLFCYAFSMMKNLYHSSGNVLV